VSDDKGSVTVEIFGHEYKIKGEVDVEYMSRLARHVDERMKEVAKGTPAVGSLAKIGILAALNIADELFRERDEKRRVMEDVEATTRRMRRKLEEIVP
jgi:cell division protein ZapA (FtsZ GTPase activity inhibitor)